MIVLGEITVGKGLMHKIMSMDRENSPQEAA